MKLDRLLAITMLLLNRKRVGAQELAERFEVSLRTIYRDLEALNQAGIPIVSFAGASGGYEIMDQYRLDRQFLSLDELQSIIIALKGVGSSFGDQDTSILLDKVGALMARSERHEMDHWSQQVMIDLNPWHGGQAEKEKLGVLRAAARDAKVIRFSYTSSQGDSSERMCEPMGVVLKGYVWYLYGYCRLREDYRIFRLTRIEHLTVLDEAFTRRSKTMDQLDFRWSRQEEPPRLVSLVLRFQPRAKARLQDYFCFGDMVTEPDGTILVTAKQPDEPWLYGMLLSHGADVKVIEPESVARKVQEMAQKIVDQYQLILT
ncbi:YafY family protein [Paenibacillus vulneris]|uniref:YafY family protein n=1 Tax=Paenibacillus vulneris TaxID=1133364 RepID=A0ABW3UL82_9BACL